MSEESKIDRVLRLILLLQQDQAGNVSDLATTFDVAKRTIHRYFEALTQLGVPWYFDEVDRRYRIREEFFLPPIHLTTSESLALIVLAEQIAGQEQIPLTEPAHLAIAKIRGQLNGRVLHELGDDATHMDIRLAAGTDADAEMLQGAFQPIRSSIRQKRKIRCRYESVNGQSDAADWFLFQPYQFWFEQRAWYVVGFHEDREDVRCLKLTRFSGIEQTDRPYAIPEDFSIDAYRGNAWRMIRGSQSYDVAIRFEAGMADTVSDVRWHPTQEIDYHEDGAITFRCRVDGLDEIQYWVLSYGAGAQVVEPQELAERVASMAKATAERYARP